MAVNRQSIIGWQLNFLLVLFQKLPRTHVLGDIEAFSFCLYKVSCEQ